MLTALAHPTRRQILTVLQARGGTMTSGEPAQRFDCTWPTTTRHLGVLADAGLVTGNGTGGFRGSWLHLSHVGLPMSKPNWKPGSKPFTTKRDLCVQFMSQGLNNSEACREAGVNRKTGQRGRLGRVVKDAKSGECRYDPIVPPAPSGPGSGRYLSGNERLVTGRRDLPLGRTTSTVDVE